MSLHHTRDGYNFNADAYTLALTPRTEPVFHPSRTGRGRVHHLEHHGREETMMKALLKKFTRRRTR